jgi:adenine phosphoribosyltransferase
VSALEVIEKCVLHRPGEPRPGVVYKDLVGSILLQPFELQLCISLFADWVGRVDAIVAPDLGVVFGGAVAPRLQKALILARKTGKLPGDAMMMVQYLGSNAANLSENIYMNTALQHSSLEVVSGSIQAGQRVAIVDVCLASGSTAQALIRFVPLGRDRGQASVCHGAGYWYRYPFAPAL